MAQGVGRRESVRSDSFRPEVTDAGEPFVLGFAGGATEVVRIHKLVLVPR